MVRAASRSPSVRKLAGMEWSATRRVTAVAVVALLARVAALGRRVTHFDEGRVGWWARHFQETGQFQYRYIIHGPFLQHVDRAAFAVAGATDGTLRLAVAVVGGLLPLAALLFRDVLDDDEVVWAAVFLAVNPVLLYYSRFFRSTVPVAAFSFVAFGFLVRLLRERRARDLYAGVLFLALAFATKENAAVYVLCWLGAAGVVAADRALTAVDHTGVRDAVEENPMRRAVADLDAERARSLALRAGGHLALAGGLFLAVSLYFYAPRTPNSSAVGFWEAVGDPTLLPALVEATAADVYAGFAFWFGGATEPGCRKATLLDGYLCFLQRFLETLGAYALSLSLLAVLGTVAERRLRERPRALVTATAAWGVASVVGYPLGTDIWGAWVTVNAVVPLAVPAGVGLAVLVAWTRRAFVEDPALFGVATLVLLVLAAYTGAGVVGGVYANPQGDDNALVQYAQPADDLRPSLSVLETHAERHAGVDVLFVGDRYVRQRPRAGGITPRCTDITTTLPLQWYLAVHGATGDCVRAVDDLEGALSDTDPLVVVAPADRQATVDAALDGYDVQVVRLRTRDSKAAVFTARTPTNATGG